MEEQVRYVTSGWLVLPILIIGIFGSLVMFLNVFFGQGGAGQLLLAILALVTSLVCFKGLFTLLNCHIFVKQSA